jgi:hypothetical protein
MHWDEFKDNINGVTNVHKRTTESIKQLLQIIVSEGRAGNIAGNVAKFRQALCRAIDDGSFGIPTDEGYLGAPLIRASREGRIDMMKILLEQGADANYCNMSGDTSLHFVANRSGDDCHAVEAADLLIRHGASTSPLNCHGSTPLHWVHSIGHLGMLSDAAADMISLLVNAGADVNAGTQTTPFIETTQRIDTGLLSWEYYRSSPPHIELLDMMIMRGANVDAKDKHGNTALHYATLSALSWMVTWLLEHGASMDIENLNGHTPLAMILDRRTTLMAHEWGYDDDPWTGEGLDDRHLVELRMKMQKSHPTMQKFLVSVIRRERVYERNHAFYGGTHERSRNSLIHMLQPEIFSRIVTPVEPTGYDMYINRIVMKRWQLRNRGMIGPVT